MPSLTVFSPAKINLFLAVTGRRPDEFHELVSVVSPLTIGDTVEVSVGAAEGETTLVCNDPTIPTGADNLAVIAAEAFRAATGFRLPVDIRLEKQLPMGAGLGGGSSNATAVLRALNELTGRPLGAGSLAEIAARCGSDCPLFLYDGPVVMRGRGERIEPLEESVKRSLASWRVLLFKPDFSISTPWAYGRLASDPDQFYFPAAKAEERLYAWTTGGLELSELLFNSFEAVVFRKFVALPTLLDRLKLGDAVAGALLSGSGSACFVLLREHAQSERVQQIVREALGEGVWMREAGFAGGL